MTWDLEIPELLPNVEISALSLNFHVPEGKHFQDHFSYNTQPQHYSLTIKLPEDANVESIERFDHETSIGKLMEVKMAKKSVVNMNSLKGKRMANVSQAVKTNSPLNHAVLDGQ